jgi:toxin HigB-1
MPAIGEMITRPKYRDKRTQQFAQGKRVKAFQSFEIQAYKRLEILESAPYIEALIQLPSNHFEALGGKRRGQFSIRINAQWRICFEWPENEAEPFKVEIVDYH